MLIFEQDFNEHFAHTEAWDESYLPFLLAKVESVFSTSSQLRIEIWPHYGQIAFWEDGEEVSKHMKGVHIKINEWFMGWNQIADKDLNDELFELEISIYEKNLIDLITPKLKTLENRFKVDFYLTDENRIIL